MGILSLADIEAEFAELQISINRSRVELGPDLMPGALGSTFRTLPTAVSALHRSSPLGVWSGLADVERGRGVLARLVAWLFRFPSAGVEIPVTVSIDAKQDQEVWTRAFGKRSFRSRLRRSTRPGEVDEVFGPFAFRLAVTATMDGLTMQVLGWSLGRIPLPRWLAMRSPAREFEDAEGRFHFDVPIELPLGLGRVVRYAGWLSPSR